MTEPGLTFGQKLRYGAEAAAFFVFMALFRVIGLEAASSLGGWLGRNLFCLLPPDRIARRNLLAAFPGKSKSALFRSRPNCRRAMTASNRGRNIPGTNNVSSSGCNRRLPGCSITPISTLVG